MVGEPLGGNTSQGGGYNGGNASGIIGALIGTGAMLYDGHQNRKTSQYNTNATIAANKTEAELAYQRQMEMWHMQNQYNSPAAQMARFKAAGLNPHLMYGQGNSGNASTPPAYQPPNIQYAYKAGNYGQAIAAILPTLMEVGQWMQDMRLKEANLQRINSSTELVEFNSQKAEQVIQFLKDRNPQLIQQAENSLSLFPYQKQATEYNVSKAFQGLMSNDAEFRYKYGDQNYTDYNPPFNTTNRSMIGGSRAIQLARERAKLQVDQAKASWTDFNITDPQSLIQMVLQGVMGMAGATLRAPRINQNARKYGNPIRDVRKSWQK